MKVSIGTRIQDGPWGGGNLFAINLSKYLIKNGNIVVYDLIDEDIDIILLTEPRKTSPSSAFTNYDVQNYIKYKNPSAIVVHRVNECDEHKDTKYINKYIEHANLSADATIFVSSWIKDLYLNKGEFHNKPNQVILAGADKDIFNSKNFNRWTKSEKIKIVTHHWSDNWNKGFDIYNALDVLLNKKEYSNIFEFNFIGRIPKKLQLNNTNLIEPLSGAHLANELKQNHIYITGSLNEPSGNHHIEAAQCGLPIMYIDSGGIKEYCEGFGVEYNKDNLEEKLLYTIDNYDDLVKKLKFYPRNSDQMSGEFLKFFKILLDDKLQIINNRPKNLKTPIKDFIHKKFLS